LPMRCAQCKFL